MIEMHSRIIFVSTWDCLPKVLLKLSVSSFKIVACCNARVHKNGQLE